jgi:hypothetical protein
MVTTFHKGNYAVIWIGSSPDLHHQPLKMLPARVAWPCWMIKLTA